MNNNLKRPTHPSAETVQNGATKTHTSDQRALATSTNVAHSMRAALNSQVDHIEGLQEAFISAASPVADQASDFLMAAVSGELLWQQIATQTQEKLQHLPNAEKVTFDPKPLKSCCWKRSEATKNQFLSSSPVAFLKGKIT